MSKDHQHPHTHEHDHAHHVTPIEDEAGNIEAQQTVDALQSLLTRNGILSAGEVELEIQNLERAGPHLGARLVARAWVDPEFKKRLLENGKDAAAELGIKVGEARLIVVENTREVHNLIVCTLCSCYPRTVLGQPPAWYVSKAYRARAVREPAVVLQEFGVNLSPDTQIQVHDSNADMRFLVVPERPAGTESMTEEALVKLVTRDSMVGAAFALSPA